MSALDPFYPIVDSAAWVGRLVGVGARLIQLRIKDATEDHLRSETHHALDHLPPLGGGARGQ